MELAIAVITVVGSAVAALMATEWFKQRGARGSIKADLEICEQLHDCEAKTELRSYVEHRVARLAKGKRSLADPVIDLLIAAVSVLVMLVVTSINDGQRWIRGADGVLRYQLGSDGSITFMGFVILSLLLIVFVFAYFTLAHRVTDWLMSAVRAVGDYLVQLFNRLVRQID